MSWRPEKNSAGLTAAFVHRAGDLSFAVNGRGNVTEKKFACLLVRGNYRVTVRNIYV